MGPQTRLMRILMLTRLIAVSIVLCSLFAARSHAVYFPSGIDWANESQARFIMSLYLNILGRAPGTAELRTMTQRLARNDSSQARLDLFKRFLSSDEYQKLFPDADDSWQVYRAPDMNDNGGNGRWRYRPAQSRPSGFDHWQLSGSSTLPVAKAMAEFYSAYCYAGTPCVQDPDVASRRDDPRRVDPHQPSTHACADDSIQVVTFAWFAVNGTTYPRGTDANTLCMGDHYYHASGTLLQRFQCESGYRNCKRDNSRDIRGERIGRDDNGNPALFFRDGSRLVLMNNESSEPAITATQHDCADNSKITRYYQWRGPNGTSESRGVGGTTICMDDYYYKIEGMTLKHHGCNRGFTNCAANPQKDIVAQRRTRVDGKSALQFRDGTILSLLDKAPPISSGERVQDKGKSGSETTRVQPARRLAGQHECGVPELISSQFQWRRSDGTIQRLDGVANKTVCMDNAFYVIDGMVLRHHQCSGNFQSCRQSRGKDLIALREGNNAYGLRTLAFANGDQLSLISR